MRKLLIAVLANCALAAPAGADTGVRLDSAVYVERTGNSGAAFARTIEPARMLSRGDAVVLVVAWRAREGSNGFTLTSPVPAALEYQRDSRGDVEVSADGGRSWGRIGMLAIREAGGARLATPEDVTHIRWRIPAAQAAHGSGRIAYRAIVR